MNKDEAREILYAEPKEQVLDPELFDAVAKIAAAENEWGHRLNEFGEIVIGGGLTADGDIAPTIRYSRGQS